MCWCVNTAPNNRWCTLKTVWHKGPIHTHYWSTSYVLFAAFFQDHSVEIFMWNKASHRGPSSPVWTLSGTALSTGSDLGHPFGLEQSRGWPALRSLAWTGGNNQPATRTASPLFLVLGHGQYTMGVVFTSCRPTCSPPQILYLPFVCSHTSSGWLWAPSASETLGLWPPAAHALHRCHYGWWCHTPGSWDTGKLLNKLNESVTNWYKSYRVEKNDFL